MFCMDTKTIQVRKFPIELLRTLKIEMAVRGISLAQLLTLAVRDFLKKKRSTNGKR